MPLDNVLTEVIVMTLLLSTMQETAEVLVAMFDPEIRRTYKKPLPKRVVICNVFDHLTCESFLLKTSAIEQEEPTLAARAQLMESKRKMTMP